MRMKTPEKIKRRLELCSVESCSGTCEGCPYIEDEECISHGNRDDLAYIQQLETELEQVKAERDRYWQYIKGLGCDTCGGDCDRCEVGLDRVWSGWVWAGEKEEVENV